VAPSPYAVPLSGTDILACIHAPNAPGPGPAQRPEVDPVPGALETPQNGRERP